MVAQYIDVIESGMPGPPGAGITPGELADLLDKTGDTMSGQLIIDVDGGALSVRTAAGSPKFTVNTTTTGNGIVAVLNNALLRGYSDSGSTQTFGFSAGALTLTSTLTVVGRIIGDLSVWAYPIDGGGSTIATGIKPEFVIPYNCKITGWQAIGDQTGSIVVDLWKDTYANYPPVNGDSMVTSQEPTISAATKGQNLSVNSGNGWSCTQGDIVRPNVDSVTTLTRAVILLFVQRT